MKRREFLLLSGSTIGVELYFEDPERAKLFYRCDPLGSDSCSVQPITLLE